ncbi:MAG: ATP-dependent protease ATPase subunit HslU [Myxococcales bacterium]|nr:ATP-dependent protease ATPase subunit HslU [Myxococcales bacterium]
MTRIANFTPREIVSELDRYIVGQAKAKRAVAIAMRNRWRRQQVPEDLRDEIAPKNIIMIGPTGVGKTEIARRLARLSQAPFLKVEASKFTEVGYVGRDVESIVRDLTAIAVNLVQEEHLERVQTRAAEHAEDRLVQLLGQPEAPRESPAGAGRAVGPFVVSPGGEVAPPVPVTGGVAADIRSRLRAGELDDESVELDVAEAGANPLISVLGGPGGQGLEDVENQLRDMFSQLPILGGGKGKRKKFKVPEARRILQEQEAQKLLDMDQVKREAVRRTEQSGIVFIDEIDKVAGRSSHGGPDVSREGVQRDLLPIVEGSAVSTKFGQVRTDHVLFVAAGAFHVSKVADLIPELQGRFPIRVELQSLEQADFKRILTEPRTALTRQYEALMAAEGIELSFTDDAIDAISAHAAEANDRAENIGARRLHTVMEALLEELSFTAPERTDRKVTIDGEAVAKVLEPIMASDDLARYVL